MGLVKIDTRTEHEHKAGRGLNAASSSNHAMKGFYDGDNKSKWQRKEGRIEEQRLSAWYRSRAIQGQKGRHYGTQIIAGY
jgi:hypothetical protein